MAVNNWLSRAARQARRLSWRMSGLMEKLQRIEQVLDMAHFSRVQPGLSKDEVLRILGPSGSIWTQFYPRSNVLAWSWLFCNSWNVQEFFDVMFDASTNIVHTTGMHPNGNFPPVCSH